MGAKSQVKYGRPGGIHSSPASIQLVARESVRICSVESVGCRGMFPFIEGINAFDFAPINTVRGKTQHMDYLKVPSVGSLQW
jgi:hypothetical protein